MSSQSFNASISVTELLTKTLENVAKDLATRCIRECSIRHGFDAETEIRELGLENLNLIKKQMSKKSGSGSKKVAKEAKAPKAKKSSIPLPFIASEVSECGCQGLTYNRGLFTQCPKNQMENGDFCSGCQGEADQNASGLPNCGTVGQRLASGLYEFKDPKGRSPVSYVKLLEKLSISMEQVVATGKAIDAEHFEEKVKVSKAHRGRPKKQSTGIVAEHVSDLFNQLIPDEHEEETLIMEEVPTKKSSKKVVSEEEKQAKKEALEQEREAKKAEREMQRLAEKEAKRLEKEAKLAEEKAQRLAEKEAKLAEEKAQRLAEKEAKIAVEKAAKELKRQQEKEEKEALKAKKSTSTKAKEVTAEPIAPVVAVAPTKVSVSRITIDGVEYLKSATNILYNTKTKEEVGLYDPISKKILDLPEEDEEEVESEYEEDEDN
jgi:hypothetical protein